MAFRQFKPEHGHTYHGSKAAPCTTRGDDDRCFVCDGGLGWCVVCGGAEASLPTSCPGRKMSADLADLVQHRHVDFLCGEWVLVEPKQEQRPPPLPHDRLAFLTELLADAEASTRLTDWEDKFCDDLRDRVTRYSIWTEVSARQWEIIERIEGKLHR